MPRCKVGDLAILISSAHVENIGAVVEVISLTEAGEKGLYWKVKTCGRPLRLVFVDDRTDAGYSDVSKFTPDDDLMPIGARPFVESLEKADVRIAEAEMLALSEAATDGRSSRPKKGRVSPRRVAPTMPLPTATIKNETAAPAAR